MTKDELVEIAQECNLIGMRSHLDGIYFEALVAFAKLVAEKAIKEALAQPAQEPVAWLEPEWREICPEFGYAITMTEDHPRDLCWIPLYAHPPQRTWVGLTDEETRGCIEATIEITDPLLLDAVNAVIVDVERLLREKNT